MLVGEAPGANEDRVGRPFVGAAGKFLDTLLVEAGLAREDVFITNVLKPRPPGNRDPRADEVAHSWPWLEAQLAVIEPELVVPLGRHALARFDPAAKIADVHGRPHHARRARPCSRCTTRRRRCTAASCAAHWSRTRGRWGRGSTADQRAEHAGQRAHVDAVLSLKRLRSCSSASASTSSSREACNRHAVESSSLSAWPCRKPVMPPSSGRCAACTGPAIFTGVGAIVACRIA